MVTVRTDDVDICWLSTRKVAEYDTMPGEARVAVLLKVPWQNRWQQHSCKDKPEKPPGSACFNSGGVLGCSTRASIRHLWEARWNSGSFQLVILNYIFCFDEAVALRRPWCYLDSAGNAVEDRSSAQHAVTHGYLGEMGEIKQLEILCWLSSCVFLWSFEFPRIFRYSSKV